jgi:CrcB protein
MKLFIAIGAGSFLGGILRYFFSQSMQTRMPYTFPVGTLGVNIIGCLFIGLLFGLSERSTLGQEWRIFLATGLCGGFTTFSAFSVETFALMRDGQYSIALGYVSASIVLGLIATFLGFTLIKLF